jgi:hypothetical protein
MSDLATNKLRPGASTAAAPALNVPVRRPLLKRAALALACFLPLACGPAPEGQVYPVRGEVFFQGEPAAGALVHFHPLNDEEGTAAFAVVQEDGSFELSTFGTNDGAEAGEYIVTLNWRDEEKVDGEMINGPDRFDGRYSKPDKSTLQATVSAGENVVPRFDLP